MSGVNFEQRKTLSEGNSLEGNESIEMNQEAEGPLKNLHKMVTKYTFRETITTSKSKGVSSLRNLVKTIHIFCNWSLMVARLRCLNNDPAPKNEAALNFFKAQKARMSKC